MIVEVYWNLKKDCWSVRCRKTGIVIQHASSVLIENPRLHVSEAGRQRVLKQQRKNVHAYVIGKLVEADGEKPEGLGRPITYNPYKHDSFVDRLTGDKVESAKMAFCGNKIVSTESITYL